MSYIGNILMSVIGLLARSFLIKSLWLWFIVPHFGVQPLRFGTAIGIILLVSTVHIWKTYSQSELQEIKNYDNNERTNVYFVNWLGQIMGMGMTYLFAWLIYWMM